MFWAPFPVLSKAFAPRTVLLLPELAPLLTERPLTIVSSLNVETPTTLTLSKFV